VAELFLQAGCPSCCLANRLATKHWRTVIRLVKTKKCAFTDSCTHGMWLPRNKRRWPLWIRNWLGTIFFRVRCRQNEHWSVVMELRWTQVGRDNDGWFYWFIQTELQSSSSSSSYINLGLSEGICFCTLLSNLATVCWLCMMLMISQTDADSASVCDIINPLCLWTACFINSVRNNWKPTIFFQLLFILRHVSK